ncbi:MAG: SH3 domain-containing protein, partial [Anaerolineae bacterium]|nr:SH3 domain-containing protein [Anaerolineae bacterium]
ALASGVRSVVLDLDPQRLALRDSTSIRTFMIALRRALPPETRISVSFDGRPANFGAVNLTEWLPFVDSWHPKVWYADWRSRPAVLIGQMLNALRPYRKPIVVLTQFGDDGDMREAGRAALEPQQGAAGIIFWRLSIASAAQLAAVRGVAMPWLAGYTPTATLGTVAVRTSVPLRIRAVPSERGEVLGQLLPNEPVSVLERASLPPFEWIRHRRGWSVARNVATGEVYLS